MCTPQLTEGPLCVLQCFCRLTLRVSDDVEKPCHGADRIPDQGSPRSTVHSPAQERLLILLLDLGSFFCRMNDQGGSVKISKVVQIFSLLVMVGVVLSICCTGQAAQSAETTWPDLTGDWVMVQVQVATADLPVVGSLLIDTVLGVLTRITQSGSRLILQNRYCFTDAKPSTFLFKTNIADVVMQSIQPEPQMAELILNGCDFRFAQDWCTEIRGAILEDPESDPLPIDPDDPRLVDLEGDGHPGMTIQASILGLFSGEGYAVQRYRYRLAGTVFDANTIIGFIDWTSEQTMVAATNRLFMESFSDGTDPDPTKHKFVMIRIDEAWTCETLREQLPSLLELLDF